MFEKYNFYKIELFFLLAHFDCDKRFVEGIKRKFKT